MVPLVALLISACVPATLYLLFRLCVGRRVRLPAQVRVEQIPEVSQIPPDVGAYFRLMDEALPEFASVGTFVIDRNTRVTQYLRVMDHPITRDLALAYVFQADAVSHVRRTYCLQFTAVFVDGRELSTTNIVPSVPFWLEPQTQLTVIPEMADVPNVGELFDAVQVGEQLAPALEPITWRQAIGLGFDIPATSVFLTVGCVGCAWLVSSAGRLPGFLRACIVLAVLLLSGPFVLTSYTSSRELALRLAVARARARNADGSGLHDRAFIRAVWISIFVFHCSLTLAAAAGILPFLF